MTINLTVYEQRLEPARARLAQSRFATEILAPGVSAALLELFLLHYCSLGAGLTEPVERWIRDAGTRCVELGLFDLGRALRKHSKHEAGHHHMMIRDTHALLARRRAAGRPAPSPEALLGRYPTPGGMLYIRLHEQTIAGATPFAQLGIEYEVERMSMTHGPAFVRQCFAVLGPDIKGCLSFVEDHVALDVGHTKFNAAQLERLLERHPEFLEPLVAAGSAALDAYSAFFDDCIDLAAGRPQRVAPRSAEPPAADAQIR